MNTALLSRWFLRTTVPSLLLCATAAAAQEHGAEARLPVALAHVAGLEAGAPRVWFDTPDGPSPDAALWARGEHWKMRFDRAGALYHASFGPSLPSAELALSPDRVSLGGEPLEFERAVMPRRSGDRVELDRASFVEAYELTPESVEQLFVFDSLPRAGELALHIPLESGVTATEREDGLELSTASGAIRYSRAVAIDARGRRIDAPTEVDEAGIVIRVDADFLATAELPLVIDPMIWKEHLDTEKPDKHEPDAVFDSFNLVWVVVYQEWFSATDNDVRVKVLTTAGDIIIEGFIDATSASWSRPRIAYLRTPGVCLVVAEVGGVGNRSVRSRTVEAEGAVLLLGTQWLLSPDNPGEKFAPTVGGDPYEGQPSTFCVAWQHEIPNSAVTHEVGVVMAASDGSVLSGPTYLPLGGSFADTQPSLSKSNSSARWTLAFQRSDPTFGGDIYGVYIDWDGTVHAPFGVTAAGLGRDATPSASSPLLDASRSAIAFERRPIAPTEADIWVAVIEDESVVDIENLSALENSGAQTLDQIRPSIDSDGLRFFVGYTEYWALYDSYDLFGSDLFLAGDELGVGQSHQELFPNFALPKLAPSIAATRRQADGPNDFLVVHEIVQTGGNTIAAAQWSSLQGGAWSSYCFGDGTGTPCPCGNSGDPGHGCAHSTSNAGARLLVEGTVATLADSALLHVVNAIHGEMCIFFQGTTEVADTTFGDGLRCAGGTVRRLGTTVALDGAATFPGPANPALSVAGAVPPEGAVRTYQVWYRDSESFCTPSNFNLSNGVRVQWAP